MPYDPSLPADHAPVVAAELRNQFNALKALIDAQVAQITDLQTQITAIQTRFADMDNQLGIMNPLNISSAAPLTQDEVQAVAAQADALLAALKTP